MQEINFGPAESGTVRQVKVGPSRVPNVNSVQAEDGTTVEGPVMRTVTFGGTSDAAGELDEFRPFDGSAAAIEACLRRMDAAIPERASRLDALRQNYTSLLGSTAHPRSLVAAEEEIETAERQSKRLVARRAAIAASLESARASENEEKARGDRLYDRPPPPMHPATGPHTKRNAR
jgi:hypothetical protein